jgi:hypothetical protein
MLVGGVIYFEATREDVPSRVSLERDVYTVLQVRSFNDVSSTFAPSVALSAKKEIDHY